MSLDTGRPDVPGPGDSKEGKPAGTANRTTGQPPLSAERHAEHPSTAASADATRHADVDEPSLWTGNPTTYRPQRPAARTATQEQQPDTQTQPTKKGIDRRTVVFGGIAGLFALATGVAIGTRTGGQQTTTTPQPDQTDAQLPGTGQPTPEAPPTTEATPEVERPRTPEGNTPREVLDSWAITLQWAMNHPDEPYVSSDGLNGLTGRQMIDRVLCSPNGLNGDNRSDREILASTLHDWTTLAANQKRSDPAAANATLVVGFVPDPNIVNSLLTPSSQGSDFSQFRDFAQLGTLEIDWYDPGSSWIRAEFAHLQGTYAMTKGYNGSADRVHDPTSWRLQIFYDYGLTRWNGGQVTSGEYVTNVYGGGVQQQPTY